MQSRVADALTCYAICRCGTFAFNVRFRRADEDLLEWMETVVRPAMAEAHSNHNALCQRGAADLKMPADEAAPGLGMRPVLQ